MAAKQLPEVVGVMRRMIDTNTTHVPFYKNRNTELTLNTLQPGEAIDVEKHDTDQIILVMFGSLHVTVITPDKSRTKHYNVCLGESITIPTGFFHKLENKRRKSEGEGGGGDKASFISIYTA